MRNRRRTAPVLTLCCALLAACGGSGGGGGGGVTAGIPGDPSTPPSTTPSTPPPSTLSYGSYGEWNRQVRATFPALAACTTGCGSLYPARPGPIRSPFGDTERFDPATDLWAATWTGEFEGYRHGDPDASGPLGHHWTGTAKLQIRAGAPSEVWLWGEDLRYYLESGEISGVGIDKIPEAPDIDWTATLSTRAGRKGYFVGTGIRGQFAAAPAGTTPLSAIGHIHREGHTAVFEVDR